MGVGSVYASFLMKTFQILCLFALVVMVSCKTRKPFDIGLFLQESVSKSMLNEREAGEAEVTLTSIPDPDLRQAASVCKKINLRTVIREMNLEAVSTDSGFNYLKYFREQLYQRSQPNPRGPVYIVNADTAKAHFRDFLKGLYDRQELSASRYAKIVEKLNKEPVVYPFVVYEWIETIP